MTGNPGRLWISSLVVLLRNICVLGVVFTIFNAPAGANEQGWVARSDANTRLLIEMEAQFIPESASIQGLSRYDGKAMDIGPGYLERRNAAARALINEYDKRLASEKDERIRQDLEILIKKLHRDIEGSKLEEQYLLNWTDIPGNIFEVTALLLSDQTAPERREKVVELLQRYTGIHPDTTSVFKEAKDRFNESLGEEKIGPYRGEVEDAVSKYPTYVQGIHVLFAKYELQGGSAALDAMEKQFTDYAEWTRQSVLPRARDDFRSPPELYAFMLISAGIDIQPEILMDRAMVAFMETRSAMGILAPRVAKEFDIQSSDYRGVIAALKQQTITDDQLEETYRDVGNKIETIARDQAIVTIPDYAVRMRLSTPAEAAAQPAPHMQPPPLIGNSGQQGEFILPVSIQSASGEVQSFDDFNFPAATWTLSAHEARPGHELQFASMVDNGVSRARALYAFNSVNAEGWALYAEAEMVPYEPVEGQLIAMQHRLLRAARAFIDPMLNLGLMEIDEARRILTEEVVLSPGMVKQELDRYTFNNPGQAASYFYGYSRLLSLRMSTETALGDKFDQKDFNDFVLSLGLLPPDLVAKAVEEEFVPARLAVDGQ